MTSVRFVFFAAALVATIGMAIAAAVHHDYVCANSNVVISYSDWCDGKYDCPYGDDEDCHPAERCSYQYAHRCSDTGECIPAHEVCDGYADCPNGEDESYYECYRAKSGTGNQTSDNDIATGKPSRQ